MIKDLKHSVAISFIIISVLLSGCKTKQHITDTELQKNITIEKLIENVLNEQPQFKTMNISKLSMTINYGQYTFNVKGSIRIITDSVVSISIQPALGIEMFRLEFQPDGFALYDKMNRRYSQNSYNYVYLKTGMKIDYKAIEAMFSHHLFTPQSTDRTELIQSFRIDNIDDTTTIRGINSFASLSQRFDITPLQRISLMGIEKENMPIIHITYGNLQEFNKIKFPETVDISIDVFNLPVIATMTMEKIVFNKEISDSPVNLSRYTKTALTDIISFRK